MPPPAVFASGTDILCVATRDGRLMTRSTSTGDERWSTQLGAVRVLATSPSVRLVAAGLASGSIALLDLDTGSRIAALEAHGGPVAALAFSITGDHLASAGQDGEVRLWDAVTTHLLTTHQRRNCGAPSLTALPDSRLLVAWDDGQVETLPIP
jgi:WD40 repeat protein